MDYSDRLTLTLVTVDVVVIAMTGLAGLLVDLGTHGRRWTHRRLSARSISFLCTCVLGIAGMVILPMTIAVGVSKSFVATAGMGPWVLALGSAVCFAVSRRFDRAPR